MEYSELLGLMKKRRSVRRFRSDPIPRDTVSKILDFAQLSPSVANCQPWEFVIVEEKTDIKNAWSHGAKRKGRGPRLLLAVGCAAPPF